MSTNEVYVVDMKTIILLTNENKKQFMAHKERGEVTVT